MEQFSDISTTVKCAQATTLMKNYTVECLPFNGSPAASSRSTCWPSGSFGPSYSQLASVPTSLSIHVDDVQLPTLADNLIL